MDLYDARMAKTQKITGKNVEAQNERYFNRELAGIHQMHNSADEAGKYLKGHEAEAMNMARQAAVTRMRDSGSLNSTDLQIYDKVHDAGGLAQWVGLPDSFTMRVDEEARNTAVTQARNAGLDKEADAFEAKAAKLQGIKHRDELQRETNSFLNRVTPRMLKKGINPFGDSGGVQAKVHNLARPDAQKEKQAGMMDPDFKPAETQVDLTDPFAHAKNPAARTWDFNPLHFFDRFQQQRMAKASGNPNNTAPYRGGSPDAIPEGRADPVIVNPPLHPQVRKMIDAKLKAPRIPGTGYGPPDSDHNGGYPVGSDPNTMKVGQAGGGGQGIGELKQILTALLDATNRQTEVLRDGGGMPLPEYGNFGPYRA